MSRHRAASDKTRQPPPPPRRLPNGDLLLYESPPPAKIQALTWGMAVLAAACLPAAWATFWHMTAEAGSPELAPLAARVTLALVIAGFGLGSWAGMMVYLTVYTTRLSRVAGTDTVCVETLRLWGRSTRTLPASHITSAAYHRGKVDSMHGPSVDAPWIWVKVAGGRGFLLDMQGEIVDRRGLRRLLGPVDTDEPPSP